MRWLSSITQIRSWNSTRAYIKEKLIDGLRIAMENRELGGDGESEGDDKDGGASLNEESEDSEDGDEDGGAPLSEESDESGTEAAEAEEQDNFKAKKPADQQREVIEAGWEDLVELLKAEISHDTVVIMKLAWEEAKGGESRYLEILCLICQWGPPSMESPVSDAKKRPTRRWNRSGGKKERTENSSHTMTVDS